MAINISYLKNKKANFSSNQILFTNDKYNISSLKKYISDNEFSYISDLLKTSDLKKNIFIYDINSKKKIILISIKNNLKSSDFENLGAELYGRINHRKNNDYYLNSDSITNKQNNFLAHFLHGFKLKSYEFHKYKTKTEKRIISIYCR